MSKFRSYSNAWILAFLVFAGWSDYCYSICTQHLSIIAHRGNSSETPENTLASFQSAIDMHADFIELDVHLCADGIPCVIHDNNTLRTTNSESQLFVNEQSLDGLKELDAGVWFDKSFSGEQIPTLEEVLQLHLGNTGLMIEIKEGSAPPKELVSAVSSVVRKFSRVKAGNPILIGSISPDIVIQLREQLPEMAIIAIVEDIRLIPRYRPARADIYAVRHDLLTKDVYNDLSNNKVVWAYTVDNTDEMYKMAEMGVSGIITNNPKELLKVRNDLAEKCFDVINVSTTHLKYIPK